MCYSNYRDFYVLIFLCNPTFRKRNTCNGGMHISFLYQQISWTLWKPWQQHQLDHGRKHHKGQKQRPVLFLWEGNNMTPYLNLDLIKQSSFTYIPSTFTILVLQFHFMCSCSMNTQIVRGQLTYIVWLKHLTNTLIRTVSTITWKVERKPANRRTPHFKYLSQQLWESQDLSYENSKTNVDAGNEAQETSQVLRGDLTEVHRNHAERDPCGKEERALNLVWLCQHRDDKYELKTAFLRISGL